MDDLDRKILNLLEQNARISHSELAEALGISAATARTRLRSLIDSQAVQIAVYPNPNLDEHSVQVMLAIRADMLAVGQVADELARRPEITYVAVAAGRFQLLAVAELPNRDELYRFITVELGSISGLVEVQTLVLLSTVKTLGKLVATADDESRNRT